MLLSDNTALGSFLSFISPWRPAGSTNRHVYKQIPKELSKHPTPTEADFVEVEPLHEATVVRQLELASSEFRPGHRRSNASLLSAAEFCPLPPQEQPSLSNCNFAVAPRTKANDYKAHGNETILPLKQTTFSLPAIREEPEEQQVNHSSASCSSLTCYSFEGELIWSSTDNPTSISQERDGCNAPLTFARGTLRSSPTQPPIILEPTYPDSTSKLQSEIARLKSQMAAADQEIQNLNAELADSCDSELLVHEAEERMAELLIEKSHWSNAQKALTENLAVVTADSQSAKHDKTLLQHDNERLRGIIQCYTASLKFLNPQPTLVYQDAIDRQSAELIWPISSTCASRVFEDVRLPQLERVLPLTANRCAIAKDCMSPDDIVSLTSPAQLPSRNPSLRRAKSSRLQSSLPLKRQASLSFETSHEGYPSKQKNYQPFEQSPLKTVTMSASVDEEESCTIEERVPLTKSSSDNVGETRSDHFSLSSQTLGFENPRRLLQDAPKDQDGDEYNTSDRPVSRLLTLPGGFADMFL